MIPKINPASQRLPIIPPTANLHETAFKNATKNLINAVAYANENEMAMLVDRAISQGAEINHYDSYDNHLMVIAVRNRQSHAIPILMARGIVMPNVPENGVDILMIAAAAGSEELIDPLINLADMDVFSCDADGKTALHHAVIGSSTKIVGILLEYGAKPNVYTTKMDESELCSIFGDNHKLSGAMITPLMIAAAAGDHDIASLLLAGGADPTHGERLPLALACKEGDAPTIKLLLAHQAELKFSNNDEHAILAIALDNGASLECLRLITPHHCFDRDDGTIDSPLGLAIKSKQVSSVALMLANGSPVEKFDGKTISLWDEAFINENKPYELLDLLVTTVPLCTISSSDYSSNNFLLTFFESHESTIPLAAAGFYPSIFELSRNELRQFYANEMSLTSMEKQLLAAFILSTNIEKLPSDSNHVDENAEFIAPDSQWLKITSEKKRAQKAKLLEETIRFTNEKFTQLTHSLSLGFFIECNSLCPLNRSLKNFILNKLLTESGIPFHISESIASIWSQAAQWSIEWNVAPNSINDTNRFLTHLSKNLLQNNFSSKGSGDESLNTKCAVLIVEELDKTVTPLHIFCTNPVAWLRKFENRSNLRAILVDELANSLQIELGLHLTTCQAISTAWATTINVARESRQWKNSADLDRLLAAELAPKMENCITDEFAQRIVPMHDREKLSQWITSVNNLATQVDNLLRGLKRPPSGDPEGTPLAKEARI